MESSNEINNVAAGGDGDIIGMAVVDASEESDDESESVDDEDYTELDENVVAQLKNNDSTINHINLFFSPDDDDIFDATTIDWEKDGCAISENTHLKSLYSDKWNHEIETDTANAKAFCNALSRNRSIKHYDMAGWPLEVGETFTILSPFFEHNKNLRSFEHNSGLCPKSSQSLMLALAKSKSLRKVSLQCGHIDDDSEEYVATSLGAHQNLRDLKLCFRNGNGGGESNGMKWIIALGGLLQNHVSKLRTLDLNNNYLGDEGAFILGEALSKNRTLKKLYISSMKSITSIGWAALFRGIANSVSLEEINVSYNSIGNEGAVYFAAEYAIARKSSLKSLDMHGERSILSAGWSTLFRSLFNPSSMLENLDLYATSIDDIGVTAWGGCISQ